jgi:outer membrane protein OmpA-like peptidoglycan-associated protein
MNGRTSTWAATVGGLVGVVLIGSLLVASPAASEEYPPDPTPTATAGSPTPSPSPTPTLPVPTPTDVPPPPAGEALITTSEGQSVNVTVTSNRPAGSVTADGGILEIQVDAKTAAGQPIPLEADGTMIVNPGGDVATNGRGFLAGTNVDLYLIGNGTQRLLGTLLVFSDGTFAGSASIPRDLAPGTYTLQITGLAAPGRVRADGDVQVVQVSLRVVAQESSAETKAVRTIVYFDVLSSDLTVPARVELRKLANRVPNRGARSNVITIVGFVGTGGPSWNNSSLSRARARTVANFLQSLGVRGTFRIAGAGLSPKAGYLARSANVSIRSA